MVWTYVIIAVLLLTAELLYFRIADRCNIIDKPNGRSSHTKVVLRGGGVIFTIGLWVWSAFFGFQYPWLLAAVTLAAGVSFWDDVHSLPDSVRLFAQVVAMGMMFFELNMMQPSLWWAVLLALIVCVGAINVYNFMDGINGMTAGYSLAVLIPLLLLNKIPGQARNDGGEFVEESLIVVVILSVLVFSFFNFWPRNKARCFAGDVGSVGIAFILLFMIGSKIMQTGDVTWLIFLLVYGIDGTLTIVHRLMLHENLGQAHRKHAYQLMANELGMSHVTVSLLYMIIQLAVSLGFIFICPNTILSHWLYLIGAGLLFAAGYVLFMKKYYHLHEDYLSSIKK